MRGLLGDMLRLGLPTYSSGMGRVAHATGVNAPRCSARAAASKRRCACRLAPRDSAPSERDFHIRDDDEAPARTAHIASDDTDTVTDAVSCAEQGANQEDAGIVSQAVALLTFSIPTLCIAITNPVLSLVDTAIVGLCSESQLAALAPATTVSDSLFYVLTFIPIAVTNLAALRMARGNYDSAGTIVSQGIAVAMLVSTLLAVALIALAPRLLTAFTSFPGDTLVATVQYVRWRALGLPAALGYAVMQAFYLACKEPVVPLRATAIAAMVNLVGDLLLCCGFGLAAAGAAAATSAANWVVFFSMLWRIRQPIPSGASPYAGLQVPICAAAPRAQTVLAFMRIAGPVFGVILLKVVVFGMIAARASALSVTAAASHQVLFSLALFFGVFGDTVCQAAQAFVPPIIGSPDKARRLVQSLMLCGVLVALFNGAFGLLLALFGAPLFTSSATVAATMAKVCPLFCAAVMLHCCSMGTEGVLLASRDGLFLVGSYTVNMAIIKVALDAVSSMGLGLEGIWGCVVLFHVIRLVTNSIRMALPGSLLHTTVLLSDSVDDNPWGDSKLALA